LELVRFASVAKGRKHFERKLIKQPVAILYNVVADVRRYNEFVPWCKKSQVLHTAGNGMTAELEVGFNIFTERYISKVTVDEPNQVNAVSTDTLLFEYLKTEWKFTPASDPSCTWVTFQVDFQFKSSLYNEVAKLFMTEVVGQMVKAFENRCQAVTAERNRNKLPS
jgi:ribosome-associated toxin RatA of RatAB toxin-antitoxin module